MEVLYTCQIMLSTVLKTSEIDVDGYGGKFITDLELVIIIIIDPTTNL